MKIRDTCVRCGVNIISAACTLTPIAGIPTPDTRFSSFGIDRYSYSLSTEWGSARVDWAILASRGKVRLQTDAVRHICDAYYALYSLESPTVHVSE